MRILCTREVQKSIKDSVHKLLSDQIQLLNLGGFYEVLETAIRGKNGSEFAFAGLATHTIESIKSFEGVDVVWVEEGQAVKKRSWDVLIPTIRKPGSEIWVTYNPELDTDATHVLFTKDCPADAVVVDMNYCDNPWFPAVLEAERLRCLEKDPKSYANIWEGKCKPAVEGAIYYDEIADAEANGRICRVLYDPLLKVHTIWDLGWNDSMFIILAQRQASEIRVIDAIEDSHRTLSDYAQDLNARALNWGDDWLPHDGFARDFKTGKTAEEILKSQKRAVRQVPNTDIETGIKAAREVFPRVYFNSESEGVRRLVECLKRYRRHIPQGTQEPSAPLHDQYSHGADDFRYLALVADQLTNTTRTQRLRPSVAASGGGWMGG